MMKKRNRSLTALGLAACFAALSVFPAFAEWKFDESVGKWWWREFDGTYPKSAPEDAGTISAASLYIDGNHDGIAELYFFDENGYLYTNTTFQSEYVEDRQIFIDENGVSRTAYHEYRVKVPSNNRPAGAANSFFKQTYIGLLGEDRSYVETVLGKPLSGSLKDTTYTYADNVRVTYLAGKAFYMYLPASSLFHFAKDSYTINEIGTLLALPKDSYGPRPQVPYMLHWDIAEEGNPQFIGIYKGKFGIDPGSAVYPDDELILGIYYQEEE